MFAASCTYPGSISFVLRRDNDSIPHPSRRRSPQAPANPRQSPQRQGRKFPLTAGMPACPRSARKSHDRPVTPEVAGSSPVAPVNYLQIAIFCCRDRRKRPPASFHPAGIPPRKYRPNPPGAANPRREDDRPRRRSSSQSDIHAPRICRMFFGWAEASRVRPARAHRLERSDPTRGSVIDLSRFTLSTRSRMPHLGGAQRGRQAPPARPC